jgi:sugar lactone lactonase YvrE
MKKLLLYLILFIGLTSNGQSPNITYLNQSSYYVNNSTTINPINSGGLPTYRTRVSTLAGVQGATFNSANPNGFAFPMAVTTSPDGYVYAVDDYWPCIRKIFPDGTTSVLAGKHITDMYPLEGGTIIMGYVDGQGSNAQFNNPKGLATDNSGNIYVADTWNHVIRKITPSGLVTTLAGNGSIGTSDGTVLSSNFSYPYSLCLDTFGNIYILDLKGNPSIAINCAVVIRKIDTNGVVSTIAGNSFISGDLDGQGTIARFNYAQGITVDIFGNLYVSDKKNNKIKKVSPTGLVTTIATGIYSPIGISIDQTGNLYVSESLSSGIKRINTNGVSNWLQSTYYAGAGYSNTGPDNSINGLGNVSQFYEPNGLSISSNGNLFVADRWTQRIRKVELLQPYTISPTLPTGLLFNTETGVISGTPTSTNPNTTYTITASNYSGTSTTTISFAVSTTTCSSTTTWDGNTWSNGFPDSVTTAVIDGVYDTINDGSIDCCSLSVTNQGNLTISSGDYCNIYSNITVDPTGILLVKSGGSLIPNNNSAVSTGIVKVERKTPSTKRFDYTYWSSPVSTTIGTALLPAKWEPNYTFTFYTPNFYDIETSYQTTFISNIPDGQDDNGDTWTRTNIANSMIPGKGYASMIKSITATGVYPRIETVTFIGSLNTGVITIPLDLSQNTASDIDDFNLVGNPYSASINSNDFIDENISNISGTLYFWTHANTLSTSYSGLEQFNFSTNDYAKYTKLGGINAVFGGKKPSNVIGSGQGFLVEAESVNNLVFTPNLMSKAYVNTTAVSFFRGNGNNKRKLWLNMTDGELFSQQLIGYNSSSDLEYNKGWDSGWNSSITTARLPLKFYSIEGNYHYDIQARGGFDEDDEVRLGYFSAANAQFTISIDQKEGKIKDVYLYDEVFDIWHDLSVPYTFDTTTGEFNERFRIRYKLAEDEDEDDHDDKIKSNLVKKIDVYDLFNRKIYSIEGDNLDDLPSGQILILKIYQGDEVITKKYFK